jgi:ribosomal small subunit protein bTHX
MGKGDIKTRKGKLANGSFGKQRKRNETMPKNVVSASAETAEAPKKAAAKPKAKKA